MLMRHGLPGHHIAGNRSFFKCGVMNILLIDGYRLFSEGLRTNLLKLPDVNTVYISNELCYKTEPYLDIIDLVICDMNEPRMSGFRIIDTVRHHLGKRVNIIVLSGTNDLASVKQAVKNGADAFLSKNTGLDELTEAIYTVNSGNRFISRSLRESLTRMLEREETGETRLSGREQEVLQELCAGNTVKDIAAAMGLSTHTIHYYQRSLMRKFKVSRTVDIIVYAVKNGLYVPAPVV